MKKIVDGKRYDTTTATKLDSWDNGLPNTDFGNCEEELYKTKNGNYFIYGSGGPMSSYSVSVGNNGYGGSSDIRPLTKEEAFEWCENHDLTDTIETEFADMIKDA
jgi:hypothetical protein